MLKGKKILFFCPMFFGLYKEIESKLTEMGNAVYYCDERPSNSFTTKYMIRKNYKFYDTIIENYYDSIIMRHKDIDLDYVFFIKGEAPTEYVLKRLKENFPNTKFIIYLWDSLNNITNIRSKLKYFDSVSSFDIEDVEKNPEILFRPLYYSEEFKKSDKNCEYDIAFVGTAHSIRPYIISKIKEQCLQNGLKFFCYLYSPHPLVYLYNKLFNKNYKYITLKDVNFISLNRDEIIEIYSSSNIILDIECDTQTGLTMRTLEILGMHKKMITTNKSCVNYDFYQEENCCVIDKTFPEIPKEFIGRSYKKLSNEIYEKYTLEYFLKEIFRGI